MTRQQRDFIIGMRSIYIVLLFLIAVFFDNRWVAGVAFILVGWQANSVVQSSDTGIKRIRKWLEEYTG